MILSEFSLLTTSFGSHSWWGVWQDTRTGFFSSGDPWQLLNVQPFSKSYEILDEDNPSQEEPRLHVVSWHQCASHAACSCGTQEEELALRVALVAREAAPCPVSLLSYWNHSYIHPLFEAQHQENILLLCHHFFRELHVFPTGWCWTPYTLQQKCLLAEGRK